MINELNNSENKVIDSDLSDDLNELINEEDEDMKKKNTLKKFSNIYYDWINYCRNYFYFLF